MISLLEWEDEFEGSISTIGEGGVADGKTSNVLRLVATVKTLARPIFVKVVDAKTVWYITIKYPLRNSTKLTKTSDYPR